MTPAFNDGHLNCFGGVAKEGGMSKAAERLDMAMQTIGAQVHAPDAGPVAMQQANQIFRSGEHLPARVGDAASATVVRLAVEITKGLPKLVVHRLLGRSAAVHRSHRQCACA